MKKPMFIHPTTGKLVTSAQMIEWVRTPMTDEEKEQVKKTGDFRLPISGVKMTKNRPEKSNG